MQSLPAGRDLEAAEEQVEPGSRGRCPRVGVERTGDEWKSDHEHSSDAALILGQPAELPLRLGVEVVGQIGSTQPIDAFSKFPRGHVHHRGKRRHAVRGQRRLVLTVQPFEHERQ
jgi:hypothetical protein